MESVKKLVENLMKWKEAYYNGTPLISDEEFDFEERKLKKIDPNNEYFRKVGYKTSTRDINVKHVVPMLSMQKVQTAEDADKWIKSIENTPGLSFQSLKYGVWIDPKIDGVSGKIVYDKDGNFQYASTRGDGLVGAIIPFANQIKEIPKKFLPNSELRGEFFISKKNRKYFNGPLRNNCSGLLKRKEFTEESEFIEFIIYDVHTYSKSNEIVFKDRLDKLNKIKQILEDNDITNYRIVPVEKTDNIYDIYKKYNEQLRNSWDYETDGIIMTVDGGQDNYNLINSKYTITSFNRFNMALKPPAEFGESVIEDIECYTNRQKISFVAKIKPIYLNGVLVSAATLNNYTDMQEKHIGIGSRILIKRSNDVIPTIVESYNEDATDIKFIKMTKCPCCGQPVIKCNRDLICTNEYGCQAIYESKLSNIIDKLEIKNIGPAIIHNFVNYMKENKLEYTFYNFFNILLDPISRYDYFIKSTNSDKITNTIDNSIKLFLSKGVSELQILSNFNIPMIGEKMLINHKIFTIKDLNNYCDSVNKSVIQSAFDGFICKWCNDKKHIEDLTKTIELLKPFIKDRDIISSDDVLYCISGDVGNFKNKQELIDTIQKMNSKCKFVNSVTKDLAFLISEEEGTTKVMKAKKYKIPVYSINDALKTISKL